MPQPTRRRAAIAGAITLAAGGATDAADRGVVFAGGMASKASTGYVGGTLALPGGELGRGLAVRAVGLVNHYRYDGGVGRTRARERGVTLSAVYQWSGAWGYANLAAGATYRSTRLTPDDTSNPNRGRKWDGVVGVDGARNWGTWRLGGLGSYQFDLREYYARIDATRAVASRLRLGAEFVAQGNPMYDRQMYGGVVTIPAGKWEVRLSGGALVQDTQDGPYAALSLSRVF